MKLRYLAPIVLASALAAISCDGDGGLGTHAPPSTPHPLVAAMQGEWLSEQQETILFVEGDSARVEYLSGPDGDEWYHAPNRLRQLRVLSDSTIQIGSDSILVADRTDSSMRPVAWPLRLRVAINVAYAGRVYHRLPIDAPERTLRPWRDDARADSVLRTRVQGGWLNVGERDTTLLHVQEQTVLVTFNESFPIDRLVGVLRYGQVVFERASAQIVALTDSTMTLSSWPPDVPGIIVTSAGHRIFRRVQPGFDTKARR